MYNIDNDLDYSQKYIYSFGGGGGGGGGSDTNVTTTTTNPVVPDDMKSLADAMNAISTAMTGSPVNFGKIPGLDAPSSGPLIPKPSFGNMFASAPFQAGARRIKPGMIGGSGSVPGTLSPIGGSGNVPGTLSPIGGSYAKGRWGDLFNKPTSNPLMDAAITQGA